MFGTSRTYLDHAAATPPTARALRAHARALKHAGNPSSPHAEGRAAKDLLEEARTKIARLLSVKADDVVFTSGATEANNLAIEGIVRERKTRGTVHVLYLPSIHASSLETLKALAAWGVEIEALAIANGEVDVARLKKQIRPETALVVMDRVCGETGTIWNTRDVAQVLKDARTVGEAKILLHVDASQSPRAELVERTRLGADTLALDAQKIGGVRGAGALVAARTLNLAPVLHGGVQERGLRPGTENVAAIAAFAEALEEAQESFESFSGTAMRMREELLARFPDALVNQGKKGVPHVVNLSFPGTDTDYVVALLDEAGVAVSTKSACESDSEEGSRAVLALTEDLERARATLRISWAPGTHGRDLRRLATALKEAVAFASRG